MDDPETEVSSIADAVYGHMYENAILPKERKIQSDYGISLLSHLKDPPHREIVLYPVEKR